MNQEFFPISRRMRDNQKLKMRTLPPCLRGVTWLVIVTQLCLPFSNVSITAAPRVTQSAAIVAPQSASAPESAPNRTLPVVQPPSQTPRFSNPPSDNEFFDARVFAEPLVPMRQASTAAENTALADAIRTFIARTNHEDVSAITGFLESYTDSAWRASILVNLGLLYRKSGYFSKALSCWAEAWTLAKSETNPKASILADLAIGELLELNSRLGRYDQVELLLIDLAGRNIRGGATEKVTGAREGLWQMRNRPEEAFRCGPYAVDKIGAFLGLQSRQGFFEKIDACKSTTNGTSLLKIQQLASDVGLNCQTAKRTPGSEIILPSVIHWKEGHFAALIKEHNGRFLVQDPTFGDDLWVTQNAIDAEGSGYFLIPRQTLPGGWSPVTEQEGATIWGKGATSTSDPTGTTPCNDSMTDPCYSCGGSGGNGPGPGGCGSTGGGRMAKYTFHAMVVSLHIYDSPVGYRPARGPGLEFTVTYNQREANQPQNFTYSNLGPKWNFDWLAYVKDDPANTNANKEYYVAGGGTQIYYYDSTNNIFQTYNTDRSHLVMITTNSYERRLPDGSKQVFDVSDGSTTNPRKIFMTKLMDPSSNAVTMTYDTNFCLVAIQDAVGLVTTISYELTNDIRKITKVTDPFGRFATFAYNTNLQLITITDVYGITSDFTYGTGDFITSLTTPYGTSTFSMGETNRYRWLEATDPLGQKERLEYRDEGVTELINAETVPTGHDGSYVPYQNSFHWGKNAYAYTNDIWKATIYDWLKARVGSQSARTLHSLKKPLEGRVWYKYTNQSNPILEGVTSQPVSVTRVLDDGANQKYQYEYNLMGKITKSTDPTNRVTLFSYDTNFIDLLEVRQQVGATNELLSAFTYDSRRLPLTAIDAAGQTNRFGYNTYGQLTAITNALNETAALYYNSNGFLTNISGAVSGAITTFTYDGTNRVRTVTDSEGYTVTFDYDALDRPLKTTYHDGTFEQTVFKWLDPVLRKDRRGHWTQTVYDPLRRVTDVQDALNRVTHFDWCSCGSLSSITDPMGSVTIWERDLKGRITAKVYPDLTRASYTYDGAGRLLSMTDAKSQTTWHEYYVDNNLKKVSYSNAVVSTPSVTFAYHTNYKRLVSMIDGVGTNTYSYYAVSNTVLGAGLLESVDGPLTNDTITYIYDELGRVTSRAIDGVAERAGRDSLGRVTVVTNVLGAFTNFYINSTLRLASNSYPNGQTTAFAYFGNTNDQRLQTIWHRKSDGSTISKFEYAYDLDGQVTNWTQQAGSETPRVWVTEHDPVDQLLAVTVRSNGIAGAVLNRYVYAYDKAGNRTSEQIDLGVSGTTHNNLNQITNLAVSAGSTRFRGSLDEIGTVTVGAATATFETRNSNFVGYAQTVSGTNIVPIVATDYSNNKTTNRYQLVLTNNGTAKALRYDLNGNLTEMASSTRTNLYEWDAANRITAIDIGEIGQIAKRAEFTLDGVGRRVRVVLRTNGVTQSDSQYVWHHWTPAREQEKSSGTVTKQFVGAGQRHLGTNYYYVRDHLGSVREMLDYAESVQARYEYDPYGRKKDVLDAAHADFGFTGHQCGPTAGLCLARYRAYDAELGRWLSPDPIGEAGGINLYAYVFGTPVSASDRSGLFIGELMMEMDPFNQSGAFFNLSTSIGEALGGALAGNWNQVLNAYDTGVFGQTECSPAAHAAVWGSVAIPILSLGLGAVGAVYAALPAAGAGVGIGAACYSEVLMLPLAIAMVGAASAFTSVMVFHALHPWAIPLTVMAIEQAISKASGVNYVGPKK